MSTDVEEYIAHFGVKGMKWGVRNEHDASAKIRTQAEKDKHDRNVAIAKKVAIGAAVVAALGVTAYGVKQGINYKKEVDALDKRSHEWISNDLLTRYGTTKDKGQTFVAGHEFYRFSNHPETGINKRAFAVSMKEDSGSYDDFGGYKIKITALKDIVTPSTKQRVDAMAESISKQELIDRAKERTNLGAKIAARFPNKTQLAAVKIDKLSFDGWKTKEAEDFAKTLKDKGYSAVWDDWDKGSSHILFDDTAFKFGTPVQKLVNA